MEAKETYCTCSLLHGLLIFGANQNIKQYKLVYSIIIYPCNKQKFCANHLPGSTENRDLRSAMTACYPACLCFLRSKLESCTGLRFLHWKYVNAMKITYIEALCLYDNNISSEFFADWLLPPCQWCQRRKILGLKEMNPVSSICSVCTDNIYSRTTLKLDYNRHWITVEQWAGLLDTYSSVVIQPEYQLVRLSVCVQNMLDSSYDWIIYPKPHWQVNKFLRSDSPTSMNWNTLCCVHVCQHCRIHVEIPG